MSICNLFKKYDLNEVSFRTFSEYTNDITSAINNDTMCSVSPSRFVCCTLNLDKKEEIHNVLQNYYEHLSCLLRDDVDVNGEIDGKKYKNYLFAALLKELSDKDCLNKDAHGDGETKWFNLAVGDIDIMCDSVIDGMNYDEIVCWLGPTDSNNYKIELVEQNGIVVPSSKSDYISGYEDESHRTISGWTDEDYEHSTMPNSLEYIHTWSVDNSATLENSFTFNTVIVLYDVEYLNPDGTTDEKTTYTEIPLGIYITPNPVTKYNNHKDIYNQGTSYSLRINMRFASTIDGSAFATDVRVLPGDPTVATTYQILDKLSRTMDMYDQMAVKFKSYAETVQDWISIQRSIDNTYLAKPIWREYESPKPVKNK